MMFHGVGLLPYYEKLGSFYFLLGEDNSNKKQKVWSDFSAKPDPGNAYFYIEYLAATKALSQLLGTYHEPARVLDQLVHDNKFVDRIVYQIPFLISENQMVLIPVYYRLFFLKVSDSKFFVCTAEKDSCECLPHAFAKRFAKLSPEKQQLEKKIQVKWFEAQKVCDDVKNFSMIRKNDHFCFVNLSVEETDQKYRLRPGFAKTISKLITIPNF